MIDPIRVALLHDHDLVSRGLVIMLTPHAHRVVVEVLSLGAPIPIETDIVLYDPAGPGGAGITDLADVGAPPRCRVVQYSWDSSVRSAVHRTGGLVGGARLSKAMSAEDLVGSLELLHATASRDEPRRRADAPDRTRQQVTWPGQREGLTERESSIVASLAEGVQTTALADRLFLSVDTVQTYIRTACRRMGVSTQAQAILWAADHGFPDAAADHLGSGPP